MHGAIELALTVLESGAKLVNLPARLARLVLGVGLVNAQEVVVGTLFEVSDTCAELAVFVVELGVGIGGILVSAARVFELVLGALELLFKLFDCGEGLVAGSLGLGETHEVGILMVLERALGIGQLQFESLNLGLLGFQTLCRGIGLVGGSLAFLFEVCTVPEGFHELWLDGIDGLLI